MPSQPPRGASDGPPDPARTRSSSTCSSRTRENLVEAARALEAMVRRLRPPRRAGRRRSRRWRSGATRSTTRSRRGCERSFITPFDREDIHELVVQLDDVVDGIQATAETFVIYAIAKPTTEVQRLAGHPRGPGERAPRGTPEARGRQGPRARTSRSIHELEHEADALSRAAIGRLFRERHGPARGHQAAARCTRASRTRSTPPRTRPRSSSGSWPRAPS